MKRILLFTLPILMAVSAAFVVFGKLQVRAEEQKLRDELQRKVETLTESTAISAKYLLQSKDQAGMQALVETFEQRERIQGCLIYDKNGTLLAATGQFA